jgi:hypothetical protein
MCAVVSHVNTSTIVSKTFTLCQQQQEERQIAEDETTQPDPVSVKQLDQQILRRRTMNLKKDVSQRSTCRKVVHTCYCVSLTQRTYTIGCEEDLTHHRSSHVHVCVFDHLPIRWTGADCSRVRHGTRLWHLQVLQADQAGTHTAHSRTVPVAT